MSETIPIHSVNLHGQHLSKDDDWSKPATTVTIYVPNKPCLFWVVFPAVLVNKVECLTQHRIEGLSIASNQACISTDNETNYPQHSFIRIFNFMQLV